MIFVRREKLWFLVHRISLLHAWTAVVHQDGMHELESIPAFVFSAY